MTETELEWVDALPPPRPGGGGGKPPGPVWALLRERPGRWARIKTAVRAGGPAGHKRNHPDFEFATRNHRVEDGRNVCDLYARFVGNGAADA